MFTLNKKFDESALENLKNLIKQTSATIVLSSTWRYQSNFKNCSKKLKTKNFSKKYK